MIQTKCISHQDSTYYSHSVGSVGSHHMYTHYLCTSLRSESCILARVDANHARNTAFPSSTRPRHTFRSMQVNLSKRHADDDNSAVCKTSYVSLAHCLFHSHMLYVPYALYFACLFPTATSSLSSLTSSSWELLCNSLQTLTLKVKALALRIVWSRPIHQPRARRI